MITLKNFYANIGKGVLCSSDIKRTRYRLLYFAMVLFMLLYGAIVLIPCLWMILSGFKDVSELYAKPTQFFPKEIRLSKLAVAWDQMKFYKYYINTFVMAVGSVAAVVSVSGLAGYVLSRLKPKGSKLIYGLIVALMLLPTTMSTVPLYMTFRDFPVFHVNMLNSYLPIWLMSAASMFDIILFKTAFDGISNSIVEAAKIDGASNIRIFFKIIIPLSVPVIITVSLFTFNSQFGNFFWPYLLISEQSKTVLGVQLYKVKSTNLTMDYQMLTILFAVVPQLLVFMFFQKYIIGGVNIGGVKG